jgi:DUF4097 and DUF4098 domain-containing protein YvlB
MMTDDIRQAEFPAGETPALVIKNARGAIELLPSSDEVIRVEAQVHAESDQEEKGPIRIFQDEQGVVHAVVGSDDSGEGLQLFRGSKRPPKVHFTVHAPAHTQIRAKSVSGRISAQGFTGAMHAKSVSGKVNIDDHSGLAHLGTVSGRVTGTGLSGAAEINSVSGGVQISESNLPSLVAKTVSGKMHLATGFEEGPYRLSSVSGSVNLDLPEGTGATIRAKSVSGRVKINGQSPPTSSGRRSRVSVRQVHELNGGGPEIHFKSVSGSLKINSGEQPILETSAEQGHLDELPGPSKASGQDRMDILAKIESGEISAAEGIQLLG